MQVLATEGGARDPGWRANLALRYTVEDGRTVVRRRHTGPLVVQKPFYAEDARVAQSVIVHPPGGIAGGDRLEIEVSADADAVAQLTTPGAAKWYRSERGWATQRVSIRVAAGAAVEWLPQENLVFDGALAAPGLAVDLAEGACFLGWDVFCLGRTESGERFHRGALRCSTEIRVGGEPIWVEEARIEGGSRILAARAGLAGNTVFGTLLACGAAVDEATVAVCRESPPVSGEGVVSRLPAVFAARYRGGSAEAARGWFAGIWRCLRPSLVGRAAVAPRIWST
jgi:urease accessory protein